MKNTRGFTLLEIIIVIIIVGVLASLALPRFFSTVEFSRSTEALASLTALRQSMERCYLSHNGSYASCSVLTNLDLEDPGASPNAHFTYALGTPGTNAYTLTATRLSRDGGDAASTIQITQDASSVTRRGTSKFSGIQ
jgi:prepilin-type N-terminal cleavage/methylation domain-containing protein